MKIEKEWITEAGLKAQVVATPLGHRCGYVSVPAEHPMYEKHYDEIDVDVHGGLTYAGEHDGLWWLGYDCTHLYDALDPELMSDEYKKALRVEARTFDNDALLPNFGSTIKTLDFCVAECESLARQLGEMKK